MKKNRMSRWVSTILAVMMTISMVPSKTFVFGEENPKVQDGNSLRIGTVENELSNTDGTIQRHAWVRIPLTITKDNYCLSLDYMAPNTINTGLTIFSAENNGVSVLPQLIRRGDALRVKDNSGKQFDIANVFQPNQWVHFDIEVLNGSVQIYINGESIQYNGETYTYTLKATDTKPNTFGALGDVTGGWYDYYGYYDNLTLTEDGEVSWRETFDEVTSADSLKSSGWTFSFNSNNDAIAFSDAFALDSTNHCAVAQISSIDASASRTEFKTGEYVGVSDLFEALCMTDAGYQALENMVTLTAISSDSQVASVSDDGKTIHFISQGNCSLTLQANYLGGSKQATPVAITVEQGNALRLGSKTSLSGYAAKQLSGKESITVSDYYISFDYINEEMRADRNFNIWYAYDTDGAAYGPTIYQRGTQLRVTSAGSTKYLDGYDFTRWTNFTVHVSGTKFELYINGQRLPEASDTLPTGKTMGKVGPFGDGSSSWDDGTGAIDNFTVVQNHKMTTFNSFDDETPLAELGWILGGESSGYSPEAVNCPIPSLKSLTAMSAAVMYGIGTSAAADTVIVSSATLNNGIQVPGGLCELSYASLNPSVVEVKEDGTFTFLKSGSAKISISATYHGSTTVGSTEILVGDGNSVQLGSASSVYGCMWRMLKDGEIPSGTDYTISFDYLPQQATYLDIFYAFDADGKQVGPRIQQINQDIQINITGFPKITGALQYGVWQHFVLRFENGNFSLYLNGIRQKIGTEDYWTMPTTGKLAKIGPWGDTSTAGNNKNCYYDNIRILENNKLLYEETFDSGKSFTELEWKTGGEATYANPPQNTPAAVLESVTVNVTKSVLAENSEAILAENIAAISGMLNTGVPAILSLGTTTFSSSDPSVVAVTQKDGKPAFQAKNKGEAKITVSCDLIGTVKTTEFLLYVDSGLKPVSINTANTQTSLTNGSKTELLFLQKFSNNAVSQIAASAIDSLTVSSSKPDVIAVVSENEKWYLQAKQPGVSIIAITYRLNGEDKQSSVSFSVKGACLQTGDGRGNCSGQLLRSLKDTEAITANEYFISFDYQYPSWAKMYNYYTWYSYDTEGVSGSKQYLWPAILQTGSTLQLYCGLNAPVTMTTQLDADVWNHIVFHFKNNKMAVYLNGNLLVLDNGSCWVNRNLISPPALGWFGDTTGNNVSTGDAYYDNIRVIQVQNGEPVITTDQQFNDVSKSLSALGWQTSGPAVQVTAQITDSPIGQLNELSLSGRIGYRPGDEVLVSDAFSLTGTLDTGAAAVLAYGKTSYKTSNPEIASVVQKNGEWSLNAVKSGRCTLIAETTLLGVTKTASIDLIVSEEAVTVQIEPVLNREYLVKGEISEVRFRLTDNFGNSTLVSYKDLPLEAKVTVLDSACSAVVENGKYQLAATETGTGKIQVTFDVLGKSQTTTLDFPVVSIQSIEASLAKTPLYPTDTDDIVLTATLSNGKKLSNLDFDLDCSFSNSAAAHLTEQKRLVADAPCNDLNITVQATFGGESYSTNLIISILELELSKTKSTIYTTDKVANAQENIQKYAWAKKEADSAVEAADQFLKNFSYEDVWNTLTSQGLPRTYSVNQTYGCPICGNSIYNYGIYPWKIDYEKVDWKMCCPNCGLDVTKGEEGIQFPTNDFEAYYQGGLDQYGEFDADLAKSHNDELIAKGETGNLVNRYYGKTLSEAQLAKLKAVGISEEIISRITSDKNWGVDDGFGYVDSQTGIKYALAADYNHWFAWQDGPIKKGMENLKNAYLYTGEQKYADMLIVILDRMADVYKDMDLSQWRAQDGFINGVDGVGKVENSVWECGNVNAFMLAFDAVYPAIFKMSDSAKEFLNAKSAVQDKTNPIRIVKNFEDNVLRQVVPAWSKGQIMGNEGMHQSSVTYAAVILDHYPETQDWIYQVFRSGNRYDSGKFSELLVNGVDQDGQGYESPFYNNGWVTNWMSVASALDGYELPEGKPLENNLESDPYKNVKFKKMFYGLIPLILNDIYIANIGDTTSTAAPYTGFFDRSQYITAFEKFEDVQLGQVVYWLNGNSLVGLHSDIFTKDPESLADKIQKIIDENGKLTLSSTLLSGSGYAVLREGHSGSSTGTGAQTLAFAEMQVISSTAPGAANYPPTYQFNASKAADEITFQFAFTGDSTREYSLDIEKWTTAWWGTYDVYLNGQKIKEKLSFVGSGAAQDSLGTAKLNQGNNTLRFVCVSDNSNFKMGVRFLTLNEVKEDANTGLIENTQRELWMTFDRFVQHDHNDTLNLGLVAYRLDMLPDLGYPTRADSSSERIHWVGGTLSHNTVLVNSKQQTPVYTGTPLHFDDSGFVKLIDVDAASCYEWTDVYRRTSAMIRIDDESSYVVDLFRVSGGNQHEFSFHAGESVENSVVTEGLNLIPQEGGTYDGINTSFGIMPDGETSTRNPGYFWLKMLKRTVNRPACSVWIGICWILIMCWATEHMRKPEFILS